jgi:hypothetical protein
VQFPPGTHPGILVARFPNETSILTLNTAMVQALAGISESELAGAIVVVEPGRIRLRGPDTQ